MAKRDYYDILGVQRDATQDKIKSAYRALARKYHPDVNKASDATEKFREATEAYEVLSDPDKRKAYDQFGHAGVSGGAPRAGAPGGGRTWGYSPGGRGVRFEDVFGGGESAFMGMGLDEILEQLGGMGRRRRSGGRAATRRGADLQYDLTLDFMAAVRGTTTSVRLRHNGQSQTVSVKIPPGVREGSKIRLRGKGRSGPGGSGDLYIVTHIRPHPYFRRDANDIIVEVPISITEAALGAKVDVPTIDGMTQVTVPPGSASSRKLRLRGRGVAPVGGGKRGDQYVVLKIVPPETVSDEGRALLEQFDDVETFEPRANVPWT
ncbi:MAG: DnaJ domain-containing protein [Phycisphaerae bacterium]|nr:DnaJ domain-containing protein [Phycisphaerae bacterium]